jgi:hypothetical protein
MRKLLPWSGLLLLPGICFLSSCASWNVPASPDVSRDGFLYVQTSPWVESGDPSLPSTTYGYSVSADGRLTALAKYPRPGYFYGVFSGKYLFQADPDGVHLNTYLIGADGSFTKTHSVLDQATVQCGSGCSVWPDVTERTGSSLYVEVGSYNSGDGWVSPETYSIDKSTGELTYVSQGGADWTFFKGGCQLHNFTADDRYAYGTCGSYTPSWIEVASRRPDGSLGPGSIPNVIGPTPPPGIFYGQEAAGTDTENHLAALLTSWTDKLDPINSPTLLVSYTINPDGSLITTNATADMPAISNSRAIGGLSPSGKLFAVGEQGGVQIFNFNGAAPMTTNGGLIPTDDPTLMQWDNDNHLFVLSVTQKLYVFTVTQTSVVEAPDSPHRIPDAAFLYRASN